MEEARESGESTLNLDDLATRLAEQIPLILDLWEAGVRRLVPAADGYGSPVTRDHIPKFLLEVAEAISPVSGPECVNEKFRISRMHGEERAGLPGYSLVQVLQEYTLLRKTILQVLDRTKPLSNHEREVVTDAIERAMQEAGQQFARVQHTELQKLADELAAADRRKNHFLALLAHELRNPLAALLNGVEVLKRVGSPEPRLERVHAMIERQVLHQARLLDDLLDVSRITSGKILLRREDLDLIALVGATAQDHQEAIKAAGVELVLELPGEPVWVNGDRTRLYQIVGNLLGNAAKFTECGGKITLRALPAPDGWIAVSVRDTGIGIEPELLPHIFDPFAQADHSLDHSSGGLGLGLALVRGFAELHGGTVRAESPGPGRGATFTLQLPTAEARTPAPVEEIADGTPITAVCPARRILVIEDSSDTAESLGELLELLGHTVTIAHSGPDGIEAARRSVPDVVLCDLGLPGINGYGVATALRWDPLTAGIRLIAISGYAQEDDRRRARQAGFDLHLTKPVEIAELQQVLATMVAL